ncbi:hypothetical protein GCM10022251_70800 [Phytohabitans flavus]|uniref:Uncharacterized protein n=1 Tax=Phytohabitans flavus TaxID=1076124 RepID=A0A6F8XUD5_9ACTN|nr:hypothetical protein [Phytohabitans flavus]BCB77409.1 hypothetical protein Pflav_038190 [Phytohabitans flavus]
MGLIVGLTIAALLVICCCGGYGVAYWYEDSYIPGQREELLRSLGAPEGFALESMRRSDGGVAATYTVRCEPITACPPDPVGKLAAWATEVGAPGLTRASLGEALPRGGYWKNGLPWDKFEIDLALTGGVAPDGSQAAFSAVIVVRGGCWYCD